jgi:hypothetical protein
MIENDPIALIKFNWIIELKYQESLNLFNMAFLICNFDCFLSPALFFIIFI